jgi:hypothetical protein
MDIDFSKTGAEIKEAVAARRSSLFARLESRNVALDALVGDARRVRSYLVRSTAANWGHGARPSTLWGRDDISSEEMEEIGQLCRRVFELEQEIRRLDLIAAHLTDAAQFTLTYDQLVGYGFTTAVSPVPSDP